MNIDFITDKLPWRIQSFLGYRPKKSITIEEYFNKQQSKPELNNQFYKILLPKGEIKLNPAISLNNKEHLHYTEVNTKPYDECISYNLKDAKYIQHNLLPTVIDNQNRLISDANKDPKKGRTLHPIFTVNKLKKPIKLVGKTLLLSTDGGHNGFFHWLCRILPKLWALKNQNIDINSFDYIIVNAGDYQFKHISFKEFNIPSNKIIFADNEVIYQCESLFGINNIRYHIEGINFIRDTLLKKNNNKLIGIKRIYISRQKAKHRKILNEEKLISYLKSKDFTILNFEDYSLNEQAQLINQCEILISIHGAGLSNIIFANPKMKLIEILEDTFVNVNYWFFSNIMDIDYHYFIGKAIPSEYSKTKTRYGYDDIQLYDEFYEKLEKVLN